MVVLINRFRFGYCWWLYVNSWIYTEIFDMMLFVPIVRMMSIFCMSVCKSFRVSSVIDPGGYLLYLYTGVSVWRIKFKPKKWIHCKFCTQKHCDPAYLLPKNMGDNFILVINLIARNYFGGYYIIKLRENGNCWKFLPPKNGTFMFENFGPKNMAFKWNFRPKSTARTPPYANMANNPPPPRGDNWLRK